MSLARLAERLRARELSPREAVQSYLDRIETHAELNAYITVRGDEALAEADAAPAGPLHGVPVAVKDVIDVAGTRDDGGVADPPRQRRGARRRRASRASAQPAPSCSAS